MVQGWRVKSHYFASFSFNSSFLKCIKFFTKVALLVVISHSKPDVNLFWMRNYFRNSKKCFVKSFCWKHILKVKSIELKYWLGGPVRGALVFTVWSKFLNDTVCFDFEENSPWKTQSIFVFWTKFGRNTCRTLQHRIIL